MKTMKDALKSLIMRELDSYQRKEEGKPKESSFSEFRRELEFPHPYNPETLFSEEDKTMLKEMQILT